MRAIKVNKRGVSEMVAYVMLIVIAISLSIFVYAWLKIYAPKPQEKCPDETSLIIESYSCLQSVKKLDLGLRNMGRFTIDGAVIRAGNVSGKPAVYMLEEVGKEGLGRIYFAKGLNVSETRRLNVSYSAIGKTVLLQVQPFVTENNRVIMCESATISQEIKCD